MKPEIFAGFWINKTNSKDLVAMLSYSGICQCCPAWAMLGATLNGGLLKAFWTAFPSDQGRQVLPFVSLWGPGLGWAWYLLCSPLGSSYNFSLTSVSFLSPFWNYNIDPLSWLWEELTGVASLCCPHHCVFVPKAWRAKQSWGLAVAEGGLGMEGKGREGEGYGLRQESFRSLSTRKSFIFNCEVIRSNPCTLLHAVKDQNAWETGSRNLWVFRSRMRTSLPICCAYNSLY